MERKTLHLPTIALRGLVVFPNNLVHFEVGREKSIAAVEWAMANNSNVFLVAQKSMDTTDPAQADLFTYGVVAEVKQVLRVSEDLVKVLVEGKYRAKLTELDASGDFLLSEVRPAPVRPGKPEEAVETEALLRALKTGFDEYLGMNPRLGKDVVFAIVSSDDPAFLSEYMPANLLFRYEDKQAVMDEGTLNGRLKKLVEMLRRECQVMKIEKEIAEKVNESMDKNQRDYYLHEQLHIISDELGGGDDTHAEADEYRRRITELHLAEDSEKKLLKEVDRLAKMQSSNQEGTVIRTYLDTCLDLPWNSFTEDDLDIAKAQRILDRDHYGLKKVKDRILEVLAVRKLAPDVKGQIICLVGPPGVGKTSIARSVAACMDRNFARMSLGGVHDEAEIRGHRKTYIGAMPGRIIKSLIKAESSNPVIILDEIDKLGSDHRGDPSSAMLEVLDPEQNNTFHDNYLDVDYDLSKVMFIATANNLSTIPPALLDRMELIEVSGYITEEKVEIARRHLVPKELEANGIKKEYVKFSKAALECIVENYTRESGVRELEKKINKVMRKIALEFARDGYEVMHEIKPADVRKYLGTPEYSRDKYQGNEYAGVVTGLAWTAVGGEILFVETSLSKGKGGKLTLTGNLGDVMKESAMLALEYLKAHTKLLNLQEDIFDNWNIHIHVPEGAIPKDGPSAGITMVTSLASALTQRKVKANLAMTGEITLRGKVLPVGGIKEKILAAKRAGIKDIILCEENRKNIEEIQPMYLEGLTFHYVTDIKEVLALALTNEKVNDAIDFNITNQKTEEKK